MVNGLTEIAVTKLDVLSQFEKIKICVGYEHEGEIHDNFPPHQTIVHKCNPVYEEVDGWMESLNDITDYGDLPKAAQEYLARIEELGGVSVKMVSVGPKRRQIIFKG